MRSCTRPRRARSSRCCSSLSLGVWYYVADEDFTFINALYFSSSVLTTVRRSARGPGGAHAKAARARWCKPLRLRGGGGGAHTHTHTHTHTHAARLSRLAGGYGDLGPKTPRGKLITCVFVLYAMVMAAQALGILTAAAIEKAEKLRPPPSKGEGKRSEKRKRCSGKDEPPGDRIGPQAAEARESGRAPSRTQHEAPAIGKEHVCRRRDRHNLLCV